MKITFVSSRPSLSGGARVIAIYADRLVARGHDVTIVAPKIERPMLRHRLMAKLKGRRVKTFADQSHYDDLKARFVLADHFGPVTAEDVPDADAVIATWWETAFTVAEMPPEKGRQFYFVQHLETHKARNSHLRGGSYHLPLRKIAVAGWLRDAMRDRYGDSECALVPNAVDLDLFDAPPRGRQAEPTVALMYAPTPFKGTDTSIRAIEIARRSVPNLRVRAFGSKPPIDSLPLPANCEFQLAPPQSRIVDIYASSDLYLFGSRSEGFGLPVLEAMACRCPVVATSAGCAPDVIEDRRNGYLVAIDDAEAMAARIVETVTMSDADWRTMSGAARDSVSGYTWDDATDLFEAALIKGIKDGPLR